MANFFNPKSVYRNETVPALYLKFTKTIPYQPKARAKNYPRNSDLQGENKNKYLIIRSLINKTYQHKVEG